MKITAKIEIDVPNGFFCNNCIRKGLDASKNVYCSLFNRYVFEVNGEYVKCKECIDTTYNNLHQEHIKNFK